MTHQHNFGLRISNRPFARPLLLALVLFALCAYGFGTYAQSATATLSGTIQDTNGAVIPGASITVMNMATKLQRRATTSDEGYFTIPLLPPATYTIRIDAQGFAPVEAREIVLNVGDQKALQIQLKAGDVNAQVTISSDAETVRTDGSVGTVINRQFVSSIPLNGRSFHSLLQLVPGVVLTAVPDGGGATGGQQFSINGQRTVSNYFMVDGVSANTGIVTGNGVFPRAAGSGQAPGTTVLGGTNSLVSLDALQEFRVETSTFAPEFGHVTGGQISLVTRSGTNQFHGSAGYYFRNEALDANDWFAKANRQAKPRERQNFFSGVLGGPIKKDRIFFFGSYEGLRLRQPRSLTVTVPTAATRAQAIPAMQPYLNAFPLPNGQTFTNGTANFSATYSDPGSFDVPAVRLDAKLTDSLTTFFRFSHALSETNSRIGNLADISRVRAINSSYTQALTWAGNSRLVADVRINWTRNSPVTSSDLDDFGGATIPKDSDVFLGGRSPESARSLFILSSASSWTWGLGNQDVQRQFNAVGTLTRLLGSHQLKFGVDYRRLMPLIGGGGGGTFQTLQLANTQQSQSGQFTFFQVTTSDEKPREAIIQDLSLFAQDTWHVDRRLTLTYGLRFERVPPPSEGTGRLPPTLLGIDADPLQNPRLAPQGTPLFRNRFGYFAPRFGVAYQMRTRPGWETTLRGGAGLFYDAGLGDLATAFSYVYPYFASKTYSGVPFVGTVFAPPVLVVDPPQQFYLFDPNFRMPYTVQWNATWEQSLGKNQNLTVAYVGSIGRRLLASQIYAQPLAEWPTTNVPLRLRRNISRSDYDALQLKFDRRLSRGVQALVSYTFGRSEDNISNGDDLGTPINRSGLIDQNFGPSDFDVRNVLSAGVTYDLAKISRTPLLRALTNNWGLDVLLRYQSALPVTPFAGSVFTGGILFTRRPDLVTGQPLYTDDPTVPGGRRFNRAAFTTPAPNTQGNFPRNGLRGFPVAQVDFALRREFKLREQVRLQIRAELFNVFNHPNFSLPNNSITDGNFGKSTSMLNQSLGGLNPLYQMGGPRSGQLALKISF